MKFKTKHLTVDADAENFGMLNVRFPEGDTVAIADCYFRRIFEPATESWPKCLLSPLGRVYRFHSLEEFPEILSRNGWVNSISTMNFSECKKAGWATVNPIEQ